MKLGVVVLVGVAAALPVLTGCESLIDTPGENFNRVAHTVDTNGKQIPIDVENTLLLYQPLQLSPDAVPTR